MIIKKQWNNFRATKRLLVLEEVKNTVAIEHFCPDSDYLSIRKVVAVHKNFWRDYGKRLQRQSTR